MIKDCLVEEIDVSRFLSEIEEVQNPTIYISPAWLSFLTQTVRGEMLTFRIKYGGINIYTYGFLFRKAGIKMFCSPFEGWNTAYIGLYSNEPIRDAPTVIKCLYRYLRKKKHILYFEMTDRNLSCEDLEANGIKYEGIKCMSCNLLNDEETLFAKLPRNLRKKIRNFRAQGFDVVAAKPTREFADLYYRQLIEVFALQRLKPFYGVEKVYSLFDCFGPDNPQLLCLKSINTATGEDIGTAIYLRYKNYATTFGSASFTSQKKAGMNHVIRWEAMKQLKQSGVAFYDFGGFNPYKTIFDPDIHIIPRVHISCIPFLFSMKRMAKALITFKRKVFKRNSF